MRWMIAVAGLVLLVGDRAALPPLRRVPPWHRPPEVVEVAPPPPAPTADNLAAAAAFAARAFIASAARGGADVADLLAVPLAYDGLAFTDAGCARRFGAHGVVRERQRVAFAACL